MILQRINVYITGWCCKKLIKNNKLKCGSDSITEKSSDGYGQSAIDEDKTSWL